MTMVPTVEVSLSQRSSRVLLVGLSAPARAKLNIGRPHELPAIAEVRADG